MTGLDNGRGSECKGRRRMKRRKGAEEDEMPGVVMKQERGQW